MAELRIASALDGPFDSEALLVLGPASALRETKWRRALPPAAAAALEPLLAAAKPAPFGRTMTTWVPLPAGGPTRLSLGVVPDAVSRHLSPSRAHAVEHCAAKADFEGAERAGVLLVLDDAAHLPAAALAIGRTVRAYDRRTTRRGPATVTVAAVDVRGRVIAPTPGLDVLVASARWAAAMVDRPTCDLDAEQFAHEARAFVKGLKGVKVREVVGAELLDARLAGIAAVGRAAVVPPRLLVLEWAPKDARRTIALVGKGIVYDTGGLALKARESMVGMKGDMGGGAAVVGAFRALVGAGAPDRLLAVVPLAENAIGPDAYRNDDVLTLHSGRTVEINNTDAEGRILLADACSHAVRDLGADVLVDAATLTGAQLIATGRRHAAVVSNREGLERLAVEAGRRTGDLCHPLPFAPELYQREFKSAIADMRNSVKDRANAQSSCAAQFVWAHVEDTGVPWLHVDLAGPAHADDRGTGFGVALLHEIVRSLKREHLRN